MCPAPVRADGALDRKGLVRRQETREAHSSLSRLEGRPRRGERVRDRSSKAFRGRKAVRQEPSPRVEHLHRPHRLAARRPRPRLADRRAGRQVHQHAEQFDAGDPVDHAVVDLEDDRPLPILEAFDEPCLPKWALAIERMRHDPADEAAERRVVAGSGQRRVPQVVAEVEVRVVCPHRPPELERHRADALAVARDLPHLRSDERFEIVHSGRRVVEDAHTGDVHVDDPIFQVKKLSIERVQPLHRGPPSRGRTNCTVRPSVTRPTGPFGRNRDVRL